MRKRNKILVYLMQLLCIAALLTSCASTGSRGSLSDAADRARDDYEGRRQVGDTSEDEDEDDDEDDGSSCLLSIISLGSDDEDESGYVYDPPSSEPEPSRPPTPWKTVVALKPVIGRGISGLYGHTAGGTLLYGWYYDQVRLYLEGGYQAASVPGTSPLDSSFAGDRVDLLHFSGGFRRYFADRNAPMAVFAEGALVISYAGWEYKNTLESAVRNEYGDSTGVDYITVDGIFGFAPEVAVGFSPLRNDHVQLSFLARAGVCFYSDFTSQGFQNDVIGTDTYVRLEAELAFGPGR